MEETASRPPRRARRGRLLRKRQRPGPGVGPGTGPPSAVLDDDDDDTDGEDSSSSLPPPQPTGNLALPSLGPPLRPPFLPEPGTTLVTTESTTTEIRISTTVSFPDISTPVPSSSNEATTTSIPAESASTAGPARPDLPLFRETTLLTSVTPVSTASPVGATSGPYADATDPAGAVAAKAGMQPGAKAGIALGSIGGVALLAGFFFFLIRWIRTRRFHSSVIVDSSRSHRHRHTRSTSTFQLAHPPLTYPAPASTAPQPRDSQVLRDLLAAAHAHKNGAAGSDTSSTFDEKAGGAVVENAQIRHSIASWLRRHHPLKLNPMADGAGGGGNGNGGNMRSSFFSTFSRSNRSSVASSLPRSPGFWPRSPGLTVPGGGGAGIGAIPRSPLREVHAVPGVDDVAAAEEGYGHGGRGRDGITSVWSESSNGEGVGRGR